jgi:acyl-CoA synthetase (NDP forming)
MGNYYSPCNPDAPYVIEEFEINPFAFSDYLMVPLDGLCRFSVYKAPKPSRPIEKIDKLLHPDSIGIIGVSAREENFGRNILQNVLANGFPTQRLKIIHPTAENIEGVETVPDISAFQEAKLDLLILAVPASGVLEIVRKVVDDDLAETVLLIPGGLGEKSGSEGKTLQLRETIWESRRKPKKGPILLGGNSLGILSHPGRYDSLFVPDSKLPKNRGQHHRNCALISQSGAYMITRMSNMAFMDPAYAISIGNQIDITAGDILSYLNQKEDIQIISSYIEGFRELDGLFFVEQVREAVKQGKEILFYKAGRTPEGMDASAGHTASIAGDYMVCESCVAQAGAMVAKTFTGFEGLFRMARSLSGKKIAGNRIAAVSNAGFEAVGMADNILGEDFRLELAEYSSETVQKLSALLDREKILELVDVRNPMDLTPMATDEVYESVVGILLDDPGVDAIVTAIVPITPLLQTLPGGMVPDESLSSEKSIARRLPRLAAESEKPLVVVVDSGPLYDPLAQALHEGGLPVFRSADQAVWILGKYIKGRIRAARIRGEIA